MIRLREWLLPKWRELLRREAVFLGVLILWMVTMAGPIQVLFPAARYLIPACILGAGLLVEWSSQRRQVRKGLGLLLVVGLGFQFLIFQARWPYLPLKDYGWLDDWSYWKESVLIAQFWKSGIHPVLSEAGGAPNLGTLHTAWHRILAAFTFVLGTSSQGLLLSNLVFVTLLPVAAFGCGRDLSILAGLTQPVRAGLLSSAAVIIYPVTPYYGAFLLKDLATGAVALLALWAALGWILGKPGFWLLLLAALFWLFPLRTYTGLAVVVGCSLVVLSRISLGWLVRWIVWGAAAIYLVWFTGRGGRILEQLVFSLGNNMPQDMLSVVAVVKHFGAGTIRVLLAPYPWVVAEGTFPNYEVYFGQWFLFLLGYPLALAYGFYVVRQNRVAPALPFVMAALALSVLILAYGGNITRQRYFADLWILSAVGPGLLVPTGRKLAFGLVIPGILLFAGAQLTRLFLTS